MNYYTMNFGRLERHLPICKVTDTLYIAGFVLLGDPELCVECASELLKLAPEYDYILTAEAKGIPLAHEMAKQHNDDRFMVARKSPKLYMTGVFEVDVRSITTARRQKLYLDTADAAMLRGKRVLEYLAEKAGGKIVGKMAVLGEGDAIGRKDIIALQPLPLFNPDGTVKE